MSSNNQHGISEISLSVEETNRLRQSLGLKPLRTETVDTNSGAPQRPNQSGLVSIPENVKSPSELSAQLAHLRELRRTREATTMATPLGRIDTKVKSASHEDDLQRWVDSIQTQKTKKSVDKTSNKFKQLVHPTELLDRNYASPPVPDQADEGAIFTLRDRPVLPRQNEGKTTPLSDEGSVSGHDELEDATMRDVGKLTTPIPMEKYDPTDNTEFSKPLLRDSKNENVHSVARPETLKIDSDYRAMPEQHSAKFKRRERHSKKKRLRSRPTFSQMASQPEVSRGHVAKLRHDDNAKRDIEGASDDDDEDAHYAALLRARRKESKTESEKGISAILNVIREADNGDVDMEDDKAVERGARLMYNEMQAFLQRVPGRASSPALPEQQAKSSMDLSAPNSDNHAGVISSNSNLDAKIEVEEKLNENAQNSERIRARLSHGSTDDVIARRDETFAVANDSAEPVGLTGIAGTLKRLREMGQLSQKKQLAGRARDKRLVYDEGESDDENENSQGTRYHSSVKLAYVDDQGNELTPKEAFRLLCHKFHGNTPGKNKNEKRLKKILENMRLRNMRNDDTPLASVAAFKKESQKLGSAHVVLSGAEAFHDIETAPSNGGLDEEKSGHHPREVRERRTSAHVATMEQKVEFEIDKSGTKLVKRRRMQ